MECCDIFFSQLVEDGKLGGARNAESDLSDLRETQALTFVVGQVGERMSESLLSVLRNFIWLLVGAANLDAVVRPIALHELGRGSRGIKLLLQLLLVEAMNLDGHGVLFVRVEFIS